MAVARTARPGQAAAALRAGSRSVGSRTTPIPPLVITPFVGRALAWASQPTAMSPHDVPTWANFMWSTRIGHNSVTTCNNDHDARHVTAPHVSAWGQRSAPSLTIRRGEALPRCPTRLPAGANQLWHRPRCERARSARRPGHHLARLVLADLLREGIGGVPPEHDRRARHPPPAVQEAAHAAPAFPSGEPAADGCQGVVRCGLRAGIIVH